MAKQSSEYSSNRKLATIVFADIFGYTAMMERDEKEGLNTLTRFKEIIESQISSYNGEIVQYFGAACMLAFDSSTDGVECAMTLQKEFQFTGIPIRMGIHLGDVTFKDNNAFGEGVNIATRIESMSVPGAVLFSKAVFEQIKNNKEFQAFFLGTYEFKNSKEALEVYALNNEGLLVPKPENIDGKLKTKRKYTKPVSLLILCLILVIVIISYYNKKELQQPIKAHFASIAVLPFDDMSASKDQEYLGDGIAEEILNTLAQLEDLQVSGRKSSFSFKNKEVTIKEIGNKLNVAYVLEGSVRKQGGKIRITAQLIKVDDGFHVWSKTYDRDLNDIFFIQDELAQNIGELLLEELAPEQIAKLQIKPTMSSEAYDLYLKAKYLHYNKYYTIGNIEDFNESEALFLRAISLDSNFALAHAGLADLYDSHGYTLSSPTEIEKYEALKVKESGIAVKLNPNSAYVQGVQGWAFRNKRLRLPEFDSAFACFRKAYSLNPNTTATVGALGAFYADIGLYSDAMKFFNKGIALNPMNPHAYFHKMIYLSSCGAYEEAIETGKLGLELDPTYKRELLEMGNCYFVLKEDKDGLAIYKQIQQYFPEDIPNDIELQLKIALMQGNMEEAEKLGQDSWDFYYYTNDLKNLKRRFIEEWIQWGHNIKSSATSRYIELRDDIKYDDFRKEDWFQKTLQLEKEKYDRLFAKYPRAEAILK